jgi:RNA polymerase sigma-70 factor (ECF subfamily)
MSDDRDLVSEYRGGDDDAAGKLFDKYCERLLRLAKKRIGQRMASRFDPEDVVQSAFRTFFTRVKNDEFSFADENDLFKLLVRLTVRKTLRRIEHHRADKRNPEAEIGRSADGTEPFAHVASHEPSPDMEVALIDEFERFVTNLVPLERQVLELKVQGFSTVEIAEQLGTYDRKIRRVIERLEVIAEHHEFAAE